MEIDTARQQVGQEGIKARENKEAVAICNEFLTSIKMRDKGNVVEIYEYKSEIVEIASTLQVYLKCVVLDKNFKIETNPSSNVVIGPIDGYGTHTIHQFINVGIVASINTDDKGIFSTSLHNEYSLYANSAKLMELVILKLLRILKKYVLMPRIVAFCHKSQHFTMNVENIFFGEL